jgi:hypothetical protein
MSDGQTPKLRGNAIHFIRVDDLHPVDRAPGIPSRLLKNKSNELLHCAMDRGIMQLEIESATSVQGEFQLSISRKRRLIW